MHTRTADSVTIVPDGCRTNPEDCTGNVKLRSAKSIVDITISTQLGGGASAKYRVTLIGAHGDIEAQGWFVIALDIVE